MKPAALDSFLHKFILHWGEMGTRWGISRSVAQIHALLYLSPRPLDAEEISDTLNMARSNVSTSLRELQNWGLIRTIHILGDRRDYFESLQDVWEMFQVVARERRRREIDPTLQMLREHSVELEKTGSNEFARKRLKAMLEFFESASAWADEINRLPKGMFRKLMKWGGKIGSLLPRKR